MGGSSNDSPSDSDFGRLSGSDKRDKAMTEATNRAKAEQEAKSRQSTFNDYKEQRKAASKGIDVMISPQKANTVRENAGLAMDLDAKAKKSVINVPVPTIGTVAMNTISSINYKNQASQLRSGGQPVYDSKDGSYQGVVGSGLFGGKGYSGNPDFDPIGRSDSTRSSSGSYSISAKQSDSGNDSSPPATSPPKDETEPIKKKAPTLSSASRRAMLSGSGGGASRRNLL